MGKYQMPQKKHGLVGDKHTSFGPWKGGVSYWGEEIVYLTNIKTNLRKIHVLPGTYDRQVVVYVSVCCFCLFLLAEIFGG